MPNKRQKNWQFWLSVHRYLGLATLLFLSLASVTGVILSFDKPLDALLNPDLLRTEEPARIDAQAAVTAFQNKHPSIQILSFPLTVPSGRTLMTTVAARPGTPPLSYDELFIDRNDGHPAGTRQSGPGWDRRHLMLGIYRLHYTLLAGTAGRWLMGLAALGWLIGNLVGVYLTFPLQGAFWRLWKKAWLFRWRDPLPRLMHSLHRASGLWALIGVTAIAFTSVAMNFFDEVFTPAVQAISPPRSSLFDRPPPPSRAVPRLEPSGAVTAAEAEAHRLKLHWRAAKVGYDPEYGTYRVWFTDGGIENYRALGPQSLYVDGNNGRIVYFDDPYTDSAGRKLSRALYPVHTGQVAGPLGIAIDVLLGLVTTEMCVSGAYLWWKRRRVRVARDRTGKARASS
ncbi:PepSY-associated TM helix domain-containing protein [Sphingomonas sp.]|uniref:PepSY-associated TM helix domain-containing protein n=1 Tax=Sphingomonas sp. TaxID=28214 RepID=UPI003B003D84